MDNVGTEDRRNIARVLDNARQEAEACGEYASDAQEAGNARLAVFFRDVRETHMRVTVRAEEMLGDRAGEQYPVSVRAGDPAGGDPGDVSPGQDDAT